MSRRVARRIRGGLNAGLRRSAIAGGEVTRTVVPSEAASSCALSDSFASSFGSLSLLLSPLNIRYIKSTPIPDVKRRPRIVHVHDISTQNLLANDTDQRTNKDTI